MRLVVEVARTADGRLEGHARTSTEQWQSFSGVLELLKVLEELLDHDQPGRPDPAPTANGPKETT
jgi:hypothetical protein